MDFNRSLEQGLDKLRAHARTRMTTSLFVRRPIGSVTDPVTGVDTALLTDVYGTVDEPAYGWVRKQDMLGGALLARAAGNIEVFISATVHLPLDAPLMRPSDVVTIVDDPKNQNLNGQTFIVVSSSTNSQSVTQQVQVRDPQSGEAQVQ